MIINNTYSHDQKNTQYGSQRSLFAILLCLLNHFIYTVCPTICSKGVEKYISDIKLTYIVMCRVWRVLVIFTAKIFNYLLCYISFFCAPLTAHDTFSVSVSYVPQ